jgi:hypothetical protein
VDFFSDLCSFSSISSSVLALVTGVPRRRGGSDGFRRRSLQFVAAPASQLWSLSGAADTKEGLSFSARCPSFFNGVFTEKLGIQRH